MSWAAVAGAAIGVVGGALSSSGKGSGGVQTTQNTVDPRIANYLYGQSGQAGLLNDVNNLYSKQASTGGLNSLQVAGLDMQRHQLMDPRYTQGFGQMRTLGSGLLGQGVAGNPFMGGQAAYGMMQPQMMPGGQGMPGRMQPGGAGGLISNTGGDAGSAQYGYMPQNAASMPIQAAQAPQALLSQADLQALIDQQRKVAPPAPVMGNGSPSLDELDRAHG
jgi:hypothetical protein